MKTKNLNVVNNKLQLGKYPLESLASKYGTPLYVYDQLGIESKMDTFEDAFRSSKFKTCLVYASKAFLAPYFCKILNDRNWYQDATSIGDIYIMLESGFDASRIVYHGNNKKDSELEFAVKCGVGRIVVDNINELNRLIKICQKLNQKVDTLFRVNPGIEAHTHYYIQTSLLSSKFGESIFDLDLIKKIVEVYKHNEYVSLKGFHSHIGSQISDEKSFVENAKVMCEFTSNVSSLCNYPLTELNLGGGFGIKYLENDPDVNLKHMLSSIIETVEASSLNLEKLYIEPGRSVVGDSGLTLYTASYVKKTYGGKNYLFVDGGMTDNIRPALYNAAYTVENASNVSGEKDLKVDVVGRCCESGDIVAKDTYINDVKENNCIVVYSTGAYCYSMSSNYNSMLKPAVIFVDDDIHVVSRREEFSDLMKLYEK